jgi:hypothetical protein
MRLNWGLVDSGLMMELQYELGGPQGQTHRLAAAIGRVGAHELAHELFVGHNVFGGGLMAKQANPFSNLQFSNSEMTNLISRCLYLKNGGGGGGLYGGNGPGWDGGLADFENWVNSIAVVTTTWSWELIPEKK